MAPHALPQPLPAAEIIRVLPTDESMAAIYERMEERKRVEGDHPAMKRRGHMVGGAPFGVMLHELG